MNATTEYKAREITLAGWAVNRARNSEAGGLEWLGARIGGNQNAYRGGPKARQTKAIASMKRANREWVRALSCLLHAVNG